MESISFSIMKDKVIDQAGYFENTLPLPQRGKASSVSGFALLWRGTLPAQPSNGFLNTHPDLFGVGPCHCEEKHLRC